MIDALDLAVTVELTLAEAVASAAALNVVLEKFGGGMGVSAEYLARAALKMLAAVDRAVADLVTKNGG